MTELDLEAIVAAQNDAVKSLHSLIKMDLNKGVSEDRARAFSAVYNASAYILQIETRPMPALGAFPFRMPISDAGESA